MSLGLVGRKVGMTRVFTDDGDSIPVTVVDVSNNRVTQIKTAETDGYCAVQVAFGRRRPTRVNKAAAGHFAKAGVEAGHILQGIPRPAEELANLKQGGAVGADIFKVGQKVDVSGISQGKGFAGVIKRHHFSSNRASHGNSVSHSKPGSIGQNQDPGRVFPGKRMAGPSGQRQPHRAEPRDRPHRRRAPAAADQRRAARLARRRRHGAPDGARGGAASARSRAGQSKAGQERR